MEIPRFIPVAVVVLALAAVVFLITRPMTPDSMSRKAILVVTAVEIKGAWPEQDGLKREGLRKIISSFASTTTGIEVDWEGKLHDDDSWAYVVVPSEESLSSVTVLYPLTDNALTVSRTSIGPIDTEEVRRDIEDGRAMVLCSLRVTR